MRSGFPPRSGVVKKNSRHISDVIGKLPPRSGVVNEGRDASPRQSLIFSAVHEEMKQTGRKIFQHDVPPWVAPDASEYFITICCKRRGTDQLCTPGVGEALLESARFYYQQQKWFPWLFLLMPDHVHMIAAFHHQLRIEAVVSAWKRFAATKYKIVWQQGFFEHRLRGNESAEEKGNYILQNPVRAGLVERVEKWPYLLVMRDGYTPEKSRDCLGEASLPLLTTPLARRELL